MAHGLDQAVDWTVKSKNARNDVCQDYPGKKMRQVYNGLYRAFESNHSDFIEQQSKEDRNNDSCREFSQ